MKKSLILVLPFALSGAVCTTMSLEHHTANQSQSAATYRHQATLHALATVAADPTTLPSYALLSAGIASISDTGILTTTSNFSGVPEAFVSQVLGVTMTHQPQQQWTVSPVADYTQLNAMRYACRWVLAGPESLGPEGAHMLSDPEIDTTNGPHFGVADRLARLPLGWLHVGRLRDVPVTARYKDHCGDRWVWVMPDGMEGLAGFTLVLQDIATLDITPSDSTITPPTITPPLLVTLLVVEDFPDANTKPPNGFSGNLIFNLNRVIRPEYKQIIEEKMKQSAASNPRKTVQISWNEWMMWTTPYQGQRTAVKPGAQQNTGTSQPKEMLGIPSSLRFRVLPGLNPGNFSPEPNSKIVPKPTQVPMNK